MRRTLGVRLAIGYSTFLCLSMLALFGLAYVLMSTYLRHSDRDTIRNRISELAARYDAEGLEGLKAAVAAYREHHARRPFFIRLAAADQATRYLRIPDDWADFDLKKLEEHPPGWRRRWLRLPAANDEDVLEVASIRVADGAGLYVGRSNGARNRLLETFLLITGVMIAPLLALSVGGGAWLASRALRPLRTLIGIIRRIEGRALDTRVPIGRAGNELDELGLAFNGLLDRISTLIQGMRGALDNVAHDLRTPISRIRGIAEISLRTETGAHDVREALADCLEESERLQTMLNTLMDISEAETGAVPLHLEDVQLLGLVQDVVELYAYVAEDKRLRVTVAVPPDLIVPVDRNRMRQVIANLLDNAIKYTPDEGRVDVAASRSDGTAVLRVRDTGAGIAPDDVPKIWDRLYRGAHGRSQRGLGLGLSLVKAVIQAHGGEVVVETAPGEGSEFRVMLPVAQHALS